jgi:hypothetical protein
LPIFWFRYEFLFVGYLGIDVIYCLLHQDMCPSDFSIH